jgi:hypothetical protein
MRKVFGRRIMDGWRGIGLAWRQRGKQEECGQEYAQELNVIKS